MKIYKLRVGSGKCGEGLSSDPISYTKRTRRKPEEQSNLVRVWFENGSRLGFEGVLEIKC